MAWMGPDLRRESEDGRIPVNQPYEAEHWPPSFHDATVAQRRDLCSRIAVRGQDLVAVLAEGRRRGGQGPRRVGEFDRLCHCAIAADDRMIERGHQIFG